MARKLTPLEIEKLEFVHFGRIRYHFIDNWKDILSGLHSRLKIKDDWYQQFISTKSNVASDLEMGAERIFHYVFSQGMKNPNSSPIGADLMYETFDSFIHIDVKTVSESNWGDYKGKIAIQPNQTSYPLSKYKLSPNLPTHYSKTFKKDGKVYKKPTLTYFIYALHKHASKEIYSILLVCMPNGELYDVYGDKILHAGKTKNSVRYAFKEEPRFVLLSDRHEIFRIEFLVKNKNYTQKDLIGIPEQKYKIPVWEEI
ncbi:MAG: hypothetical protein DRN25_03780 [Thermoplasmata archaeon]|nr:MAG: hypothetical protein FE042_03700 [Thermoplasmata archaeon]RLF41572.1 MAG: hypothetical protein DRN18_03620 [Thermoplasmata archaeon]RLF59663.1 MAG: hypothetical protein DRN25_03780 [Thermoplasmata archaeon]HDD57449.1 hypothetical protein [Thermoplasmatales archaeon]